MLPLGFVIATSQHNMNVSGMESRWRKLRSVNTTLSFSGSIFVIVSCLTSASRMWLCRCAMTIKLSWLWFWLIQLAPNLQHWYSEVTSDCVTLKLWLDENFSLLCESRATYSDTHARRLELVSIFQRDKCITLNTRGDVRQLLGTFQQIESPNESSFPPVTSSVSPLCCRRQRSAWLLSAALTLGFFSFLLLFFHTCRIAKVKENSTHFFLLSFLSLSSRSCRCCLFLYQRGRWFETCHWQPCLGFVFTICNSRGVGAKVHCVKFWPLVVLDLELFLGQHFLSQVCRWTTVACSHRHQGFKFLYCHLMYLW